MKTGDLISVRKDSNPDGLNRILPKGDLLTITDIGPFGISCYSIVLEQSILLTVDDLDDTDRYSLVIKKGPDRKPLKELMRGKSKSSYDHSLTNNQQSFICEVLKTATFMYGLLPIIKEKIKDDEHRFFPVNHYDSRLESIIQPSLDVILKYENTTKNDFIPKIDRGILLENIVQNWLPDEQEE